MPFCYSNHSVVVAGSQASITATATGTRAEHQVRPRAINRRLINRRIKEGSELETVVIGSISRRHEELHADPPKFGGFPESPIANIDKCAVCQFAGSLASRA